MTRRVYDSAEMALLVDGQEVIAGCFLVEPRGAGDGDDPTVGLTGQCRISWETYVVVAEGAEAVREFLKLVERNAWRQRLLRTMVLRAAVLQVRENLVLVAIVLLAVVWW